MHTLAARRRANLRGPFRIVVAESPARAQLDAARDLRIVARGDPDVRAERARDLHAERRHARTAARDQHAPSRCDSSTRDDRAPGRQPGQWKGRRLLPAQGARLRVHVDRGYDHALGEGSLRRRPEDVECLRRRALVVPPAERGVDDDLVARSDAADAIADQRHPPAPSEPSVTGTGVPDALQSHQSRRLSAAVTSSTTTSPAAGAGSATSQSSKRGSFPTAVRRAARMAAFWPKAAPPGERLHLPWLMD